MKGEDGVVCVRGTETERDGEGTCAGEATSASADAFVESPCWEGAEEGVNAPEQCHPMLVYRRRCYACILRARESDRPHFQHDSLWRRLNTCPTRVGGEVHNSLVRREFGDRQDDF